MIEELFLALVMSLVFAVPAWYLCLFAGNFAVFWLAWLLSLADGIGAQSPPLMLNIHVQGLWFRGSYLHLSEVVSSIKLELSLRSRVLNQECKILIVIIVFYCTVILEIDGFATIGSHQRTTFFIHRVNRWSDTSTSARVSVAPSPQRVSH